MEPWEYEQLKGLLNKLEKHAAYKKKPSNFFQGMDTIKSIVSHFQREEQGPSKGNIDKITT